MLVAQDVTRYGEDIYGEKKLVSLIRELSKIETIKGIRLLYCYPDVFSDELIEEIANNDKVIKYVDIPLQHSENAVLKRMNRRGKREDYLNLIAKLKDRVKGIAIRSTFIAGFPGETEEDFNGLVDFIKKAKFNSVGFFAYSREEGTPAYKLKDQIDEDIKISRVEKLYEVQRKISSKNLKSFVGKTLSVIADGIDYEKQSFYGRAYFQCPDVDGKVYLSYDGAINQGERYDVLI